MSNNFNAPDYSPDIFAKLKELCQKYKNVSAVVVIEYDNGEVTEYEYYSPLEGWYISEYAKNAPFVANVRFYNLDYYRFLYRYRPHLPIKDPPEKFTDFLKSYDSEIRT